jgi:uncharacterized membrane protein YebE (DUF533 family)
MAKKPVVYDASLIQEFAERLYKQAGSIILSSTLLGLFGGAIAGVVVVGVSAKSLATSGTDPGGAVGIALIVGAVVGGFWGFSRGRERAFKLKLEAQVALCQVQIEKNTGGQAWA